MKKTKKPSRPATVPRSQVPSRRKSHLVALRERCESIQMTPVVQNSYVLSRFWAWFSRIQMSPTVSIPVPRFLTYRDP